MKNAIIYSRVSTEDQDNDRQIEELIELAKGDGFPEKDIVVYSDKISGFTKAEDRKGFQALQKRVNSESVIYVWEVSRLARNLRIVLEIVEYFNSIKIPIIIKKENIRTLDENGKESQQAALMLALFGTIANQEIKTFKERSISGRRKAVRDGKAIGGIFTPYGFRKDENKMLVIDEDEAEVIKQIFQLSLDGNGTKKIANILNANGVPTKSNKLPEREMKVKTLDIKQSSKEIKWKDAVVYTILTNKLYKGIRVFSGQETKITPIIEESAFDLVQKRLTERKVKSPRNTRYPYLFRDKIRCGVCGKPYLAINRATGKDSRFVCSSKRVNESCGNGGISIHGLETSVWSLITDVDYISHISTNRVSNIENVENLNNSIKNQESIIQSYMLEIENCNKSKERILGLYAENNINKNQFLSKTEEYNNKIADISKSIDKAELEIQSIKARIELIQSDNFKQIKIEELSKDRSIIKEILDIIIKNVVIYQINNSESILIVLDLVPLAEFGSFSLLDSTIYAIYDRRKHTLVEVDNSLKNEHLKNTTIDAEEYVLQPTNYTSCFIYNSKQIKIITEYKFSFSDIKTSKNIQLRYIQKGKL